MILGIVLIDCRNVMGKDKRKFIILRFISILLFGVVCRVVIDVNMKDIGINSQISEIFQGCKQTCFDTELSLKNSISLIEFEKKTEINRFF